MEIPNTDYLNYRCFHCGNRRRAVIRCRMLKGNVCSQCLHDMSERVGGGVEPKLTQRDTLYRERQQKCAYKLALVCTDVADY